MGKATVSEVWKTKYGTRRVRYDPPTLKEAIAAARGLTGELHQQAEIAASLINLPMEEVRAELLKTAPARNSAEIVTSSGREGHNADGARRTQAQPAPRRRDGHRRAFVRQEA